MREILFRGRSVDTGEWVYGWYEEYPFKGWPTKAGIIPSYAARSGWHRHVEVDPNTVGEWTGLYDKAGKRIFEGDVFAVVAPPNSEVDGSKFRVVYGLCGGTWSDEVRTGYMGFYCRPANLKAGLGHLRNDPAYWLDAYDCYVVEGENDGMAEEGDLN